MQKSNPSKKITKQDKIDKSIESLSKRFLRELYYKEQPGGLNAFKMDPTRIKLTPQEPGANLYSCIRGFIPGEVTSRTYFKAVVCGKEYCKNCGKDYSISHNRRVNRSYKYISQLENVGYLVVTIPKQLRDKFKSKEELNKFRNYIRRKLKNGTTVYHYAKDHKTGERKKVLLTKTNFTKGLLRYHWTGEDNRTWKPHLNILLDSKYITPGLLAQFREDLINWFKFNYNHVGPSNIYFAYSNKPGKIKHWLKYVLRGTALKVTDSDVIDTIHKYRNTSYFGKFDKPGTPREQTTAILSGVDPDTGEFIKWQRMIKPGVFYNEYKNRYKKILIEAKPGLPHLDLGLYIVEKFTIPLPDK